MVRREPAAPSWDRRRLACLFLFRKRFVSKGRRDACGPRNAFTLARMALTVHHAGIANGAAIVAFAIAVVGTKRAVR